MAEPILKLADLPKVEPFALHPDDRAAIEHETHHYEDPRAASIEALKIVQHRHGWVPDGAIPAIGEVLGIPGSDVEGVATFYNLIFRRPVGRHVILLCDSVACWLMGETAARAHLRDRLGIRPGGTTADGRFTLLPIVCLGHCDHAPAMMVDEDQYGDLDAARLDAILDRYP